MYCNVTVYCMNIVQCVLCTVYVVLDTVLCAVYCVLYKVCTVCTFRVSTCSVQYCLEYVVLLEIYSTA